MTELQNQSILHEIQLGRVENGIIQDCVKALENANRMIAIELKKTKGVWTKKRYEEISKYIQEVTKELQQAIDNGMEVDEFIGYELKAQVKLFKEYGGINLKLPIKEQIVSTATFSPYTESSTFGHYLNSFGANYFNLWDSQVRGGYLNGISTQKIIKSVMGGIAKDAQVQNYGLMNTLYNSLVKNTRTALQSFANNTREMIYAQNEDVIDGYEWLATLDRRTCLVCGELDGKKKKKIKDFGIKPPAHYNCRCVIVPTIENIPDDTRASENGQVDVNITFAKWLKMQPQSIQKDILGEYRFKKYQEGQDIGSFVQDNKIIRIKDLQE